MIEILFGESEAASMKVAKNTKNSKVRILKKVEIYSTVEGEETADGPTAWIGNPPSERKRTGRIEWIEGKASEVICLGFMLDIGDIQKEVDSQYRQNMIYSMYAQNQWDQSSEMIEELKQVGEQYRKEWDKLIEYLENRETIRIWYSDSPYSLCGFYWLCYALRKYENDIFTVKFPKYRQLSEHMITSYNGWGEVPAEELSQFLTYQRKLTALEKKMFGNFWSELKEDNSPLRAVISGKLTGVPKDFYDFLIRKHLTDKPVKEGRVIGNILGYHQLGIGDWWYAFRIEEMIKSGEIKVVEDSKSKYARLICRGK